MDHTEVAEFWESNAEAWTKLARAGYDVYRDHLNTPAGGSEPGSYSWTLGGSTHAVGGIQAFVNVDTADPIDVGNG